MRYDELGKIVESSQEVFEQGLKGKTVKEIMDAFHKFLDEVNSKSKIVKLEKDREDVVVVGDKVHGSLTFVVKFVLDDPYVDKETYEKGEAYIYPSELFYEDVDKAAKKYLGVEPRWNNTKTIGWFVV